MSNIHRKCAKCGRTRAEDLTVTYHTFPDPGTTNLSKARAWATFCWPDGDWSSSDSLYTLHNQHKVLCGRHFNSTQFYDSGRQKLSKFAVPDAPEVQTLLNKENVFNVNIQQSIAIGLDRTSEVPFSQIENIMVQSNLAKVAVEEPGTSKSSGGVHNAPTQWQFPVDSGVPQSLAKRRSGILGAINASKISELSKREVILYNTCKKKIKEIARLRTKLKKKKVDIVQKVCEDENVKKLCNLNIKTAFAVLLQTQLKNAPKKPKGRRYTLNQKIMALVIYKKSPACYRLLRRMFTLPCQSSLNKLLNRVPLKPGINKHIFLSLKQMAEKQENYENICVLSFDEMSLKKHLYYNRKLDLIQGFQDHDNHGRSHQIANKALVFMFAGLRKKWKQPIAFYLSHTLNADRMTVILKEILAECFLANMTVVATVCDMSTINVKTLKTLGVTTRDPYFVHCEREIVAVLDPPHLLKCTRNMFIKHDIECISSVRNDENEVKGIAKWSHIKKFYELEKNNSNFVYAPKLTEHHLNPNVQQKMRVKLAAQVFSHAVAGGMLSKIASNELPSEAHVTATVLQKFDQLFDALNADSPDLRGGKKFSTNLSRKSPHFAMFAQMKIFIKEMKYVGSKFNPPSQEGWIHTINAVERLWMNLSSIPFIKSLSTRRLNQDPLENCFGCIRYSCGSNYNPTIVQFTAGIKTAIITNLQHAGQKKNCEDDSALLCNNFVSFLTAENMDTPNSGFVGLSDDDIEIAIADAIETIDQVTPESQACGYVCGFIFKKLKNNNCPECRNIYLAQNKEPIHIFTSLKEYDESSDSLNYASKTVIQCVEVMASIINNFLRKEAWRPQLKSNILNLLDNVEMDFFKDCPRHIEINKKYLKNSIFFICIKRYTILKNRDIDEEQRNKTLERKMKILQNK